MNHLARFQFAVSLVGFTGSHDYSFSSDSVALNSLQSSWSTASIQTHVDTHVHSDRLQIRLQIVVKQHCLAVKSWVALVLISQHFFVQMRSLNTTSTAELPASKSHFVMASTLWYCQCDAVLVSYCTLICFNALRVRNSHKFVTNFNYRPHYPAHYCLVR